MKPVITNSIRMASLIVMAMGLGGCSSLGPIPQGKSIVFGSISVNTEERLDYKNSLYGSVSVINTRVSRGVLEHPIKRFGGPFYWVLPPGRYAILDLRTSRVISIAPSIQSKTDFRRIYAEFSIDSEGTVVYVGTLDLASPSPSVSDDFDTAVQALHTHFPALNTTPTKKLLHLEKQK